MKCQVVLPACLLLLWTLTASVSCQEIQVEDQGNGLKLTCGDKTVYKYGKVSSQPLPYKDESTGEYECEGPKTDEPTTDELKIYVKIRTCDNCIELDVPSIAGIIIGNLVATIVIGVAVYLTASQNRIGPITSHKKSSDRQTFIPHEASSRAPTEHYEPLKRHQKDTYDKLNRK